jgi:adenylate kinase family enzyme
VVEFYEQRNLLKRVDANQTPEDVYNAIVEGVV